VNDVWIKIRNTVQQTAKTTIGIKEKRKNPGLTKYAKTQYRRERYPGRNG